MALGASPFEWLRFTKDAKLEDPAALERIRHMVNGAAITDLVVLSHGWNNDLDDAESLYRTLWGNVSAEFVRRGRDPAHFAVIGILWPAKAYDARYDGAEELIAAGGTGGALAIDGEGSQAQGDAPVARLDEMLAQIGAFVDDPDFDAVVSAAKAAAAVEDDMAAKRFFEAAMRSLEFDEAPDDPELRRDAGQFGAASTLDGASELLGRFAAPFALEVEPGVGAAQGLGDRVRGVFSGARSGVIWALNKLTYYTMKKRAGLVGEAVAHALSQLAPNHVLRLHLVGHSFGGRLVTATAHCHVTVPAIGLRSLTLLQAAYSHNGMSDGKGPFSDVLSKVSGPISFTHTHNDKACTVAYPIASRLSGDTTKGLGDANDPFGAMGANGPQLAATFLAPDCKTGDFNPVVGKVNRFLADAYVVKTAQSDAHNNVTNADCGRLVAATIVA